jgi:Microtubule-binding protein MIP-T3 CH-like domain/Microtubule-binding protein MIP-T3 C-terminal region
MSAEEIEPWVAATQASLGQLVQKPKLIEKYLRKPPFKFLHDCINEGFRLVEFPVNSLLEEQLINPESAGSSKEAKIEFLTRTLNFIGNALNENLSSISPAKIVSGLEPENTNLMLQKLHQVLVIKGGKSVWMEAISKSQGGKVGYRPMSASVAVPRQAAPAAAAAPAAVVVPEPAKSAPVEAPSAASPEARPPSAVPSASIYTPQAASQSLPERPRTAQKKPPKSAKLPAESPSESVAQAAAPVIIEDGENEELKVLPGRTTSATTLAREGFDFSQIPGDSTGHLVQDILAATDQQTNDASANNGIKMEKIRRRGSNPKPFDSEQLKKVIQMLVDQVSGFSKLVESLNFDLNVIQREHDNCKQELAKVEKELARERQITEDSLAPKKRQLDSLDDQIAQKHLEISQLQKQIQAKENSMMKKIQNICTA